MDYYNNLTPQQLEMLAILSEECGEVVQRIGKILRHGLNSVNPNTKIDNTVALECELGDICAAMESLAMLGIIDLEVIQNQMNSKLEKFKSGEAYLRHFNIAG